MGGTTFLLPAVMPFEGPTRAWNPYTAGFMLMGGIVLVGCALYAAA